MTQEVQTDKDTVTLDSEKLYSGAEKPDGEEKLVRKALKLPLTKKIVFYKDKRKADSVVDVITFQLKEMYDISERWYTIEVTLADGTKTLIHSGYLIEMQKASFVDDMAAQMA